MKYEITFYSTDKTEYVEADNYTINDGFITFYTKTHRNSASYPSAGIAKVKLIK